METVYDNILDTIPSAIDCDFITVKNETVRTFTFTNPSEFSIYFDITYNPGTFIFEPSKGVLHRNKKTEIKLKILPAFANVLVANAKLTLDNKVSKIIKMSFISKYPNLRINSPSIDFGIVQIGKTSSKEIIIINNENVPAKFLISKESVQPGKHPEVFSLSSFSGDIPPASSYLIKIVYKPYFPSVTSYDTYKIQTIGGNLLRFALSGSCSSLNTWINAKNINFKSIPLGNQLTKLIRVYNDSDQATDYQIYHENSGAFIIKNPQGKIEAKSNVRVNITFRPYETMIYYERMFCWIKNHFLLCIDLFGSCHDWLTKTNILNQNIIDIFRYKVMKGYFLPNSKWNNADHNNEIMDKLNKSFMMKATISAINSGETGNSNDDAWVEVMSQTQMHKEMFWNYTDKTRIISFDTEHIDFNYVQCGSTSEPYFLHVQNNSNETCLVKFIFDKPINTSNLVRNINIFTIDSTIFFIQPEEKELKPNTSGEFKVYFKPNKPEFYFYSDWPCWGMMQTSYKEKKSRNMMYHEGGNEGWDDINKNKLSDAGQALVSLKPRKSSSFFGIRKPSSNVWLKSMNERLNIGVTGEGSKQIFIGGTRKMEYFDPPIPIKISMVGHSFPPGTQIFMPMFEFSPKKEIFFPSASINQSIYQTLKIQNRSDTPLFYKLSPDPSTVFRTHRKFGLIPANDFHLICIEFCPKEATVYRFPLRIMFNHDTRNMSTILLNGLCTDPVIEIEGIKSEIYFPPSFIGIKTTKSIIIKNLSPIKINVNIQIIQNQNSVVEVTPNSFEMNCNLVKKIDIAMCPKENTDISTWMIFTAERVYNPESESIGLFNPGSSSSNTKQTSTGVNVNWSNFDRRCYRREVVLLGKGSDGDWKLEPEWLEFGTVKVGFHKKMTFSIFNPTMTNFYVKLVPEYYPSVTSSSMHLNKASENSKDDDSAYYHQSKKWNINEIISFDFTEGLWNSFCKKDIHISFYPKNRANVNWKLKIYATDNTSDLISQLKNKNPEYTCQFDPQESLKCEWQIKANGDYPLLKIVDIRNSFLSTVNLWNSFNVNAANEELQKQLTEEEINYISGTTGKKIRDIREMLKSTRFEFGKHIYRKTNNRMDRIVDVYWTWKNEGGVTSEFFFKFPDDIAIKREIWMDPVEPTSNDKVEYHVLKEHIFEIEPRKSKWEPNECCNIRFRYNIKEKGAHRLRVIFQIVNGKPLIFELTGETLMEKSGFLNIPKPIVNFGYVPIGHMTYLASPIEIVNSSGLKIHYNIEEDQINEYNKSCAFEIFKLENAKALIGPGESKFWVAYFRPLTDKFYEMKWKVKYHDDVDELEKEEVITIQGNGYHPLKYTPEPEPSPYLNMPNCLVHNRFNKDMIKKCGLSLEELDFGSLSDQSKNKTLIIYNYSNCNSFNFDFSEPGFIVEDELMIVPNKGLIEPNAHKIIKLVLKPKQQASRYQGDIKIRITWNSNNNNNANNTNVLNSSVNPLLASTPNPHMINFQASLQSATKILEKENLFIRVIKECELLNIPGKIKQTANQNLSFIETILNDLACEILCDKEFDDLIMNNIEKQPLGLYEWTNDKPLPTHGKIREEYIENLFKIIKEDTGMVTNTNPTSFKKANKMIEGKTVHKGANNQNNEAEQVKHKTEEKDEFGEEEDMRIQDKYMEEVRQKYKLSIQEMNEKLIVVNEDSRRLISDVIMENTVYNIISEAVYGETDLTEKPRIYFFAKK